MFRAVLAATLALTLAACGQGEAEAPTKGVVNLYTARHYDADLKLYDAFTKKTGVKVNRLEMEPDQLIERMKAEGSASPADVILMADAGALWRAQQAGLFQPVMTETLEQRIPQNVRETSGLWWGFSRRARVVAYDKAKVRPEEVATYAALASPRFKGQVCVRSSDNVYNLSLMAALIDHWGRERALQWARGVVGNMARKPQGGDIDQIRAIAAGACQVALTNSYYFLRIATSDNPGDKAVAAKVALAFPEQAGVGAHVNISGGGVAANAPHKDAAIQFLEFLAGDEAQAVFAGANHEYPAVPGVKPPADVEAYSHFKADPMPVVTYGRRQAEAQGVFDEAGWR
jgi:iron(III) transport system substrate-binding protein